MSDVDRSGVDVVMPTIGRIVRYRVPRGARCGGTVCPAIVCAVNSDGTIAVCAFLPHESRHVHAVRPEDAGGCPGAGGWSWLVDPRRVESVREVDDDYGDDPLGLGGSLSRR
jgi:hypothetical protein